jgi:hypothetical protein
MFFMSAPPRTDKNKTHHIFEQGEQAGLHYNLVRNVLIVRFPADGQDYTSQYIFWTYT